jgi:sulfite reductase (NADPH) hemoprotein beta-component
MAAIDDPQTLGRTRLSFANPAEIDEFVRILGEYERGEISADQWRTFRLLRGTYGQRQDGVQMLRVKIPQGALDSRQLRSLADVAERWSRGFGHITTRQNLQFHFIPLPDVPAALELLAGVGLTTREACGNSVRNITACPYAGVSEDEAFDVTPYSEALTRYFLRHRLSSSLPRKFKIGFEACTEDHAFTSINDIGWRGLVRPRPDGSLARGFRVTAGGGTATMAKSGQVLVDFAPVAEMLDVAEAIVRVYHRLGDYQHKHKNRMKFLIKSIGWDRFKAEFETELAQFRAEGGARLPFDPDAPPVEGPPDWIRPAAPAVAEAAERVSQDDVRGPGIVPEVRPVTRYDRGGFEAWRATNVRPQKQRGYALVTASIPLGDMTSQQMRVLADLADAYSDGSVRVSPEQDLVFRWIRQADVEPLYARLAASGLGLAGAGTIADVTSCPGAESCRLAVTQSRGLGSLLESHLRQNPEIAAIAPELRIKISGCPNGCGQHHVAGLGFQGSIRKVGDRAVPQYFVMLGGGVDGDAASFGRIAAKVPARRIPETVDRLLGLYRDEKLEGEPAVQFFRRLDSAKVKSTLADLETLTPADAVPADFIDLGETQAFVPEVMDGECAT